MLRCFSDGYTSVFSVFLLVMGCGCTETKTEVPPVVWLATINASAGKIVKKVGETERYELVLTFPVSEVPKVTLFSDRPHRLIKQVSLPEFILSWQNQKDLSQNPPNISLQYTAGSDLKRKEEIAVLSHPSFEVRTGEALARFELSPLNKKNPLRGAEEIKEVTLFIDGFFSSLAHDIEGGFEDVYDAVKKAAEEAYDAMKSAVSALKNEAEDVVNRVEKAAAFVDKIAPIAGAFIVKEAKEAGSEIKTIADDIANEFKCWGILIGNDVVEATIDVAEAVATDGTDEIAWEITLAGLDAGTTDAAVIFLQNLLQEIGLPEDLSNCIGDLATPLIQMAQESLTMEAFFFDVTQQIEAWKAGCDSIFTECH